MAVISRASGYRGDGHVNSVYGFVHPQPCPCVGTINKDTYRYTRALAQRSSSTHRSLYISKHNR